MLPNPASSPHGPSIGRPDSKLKITDFTIWIPDSKAKQATGGLGRSTDAGNMRSGVNNVTAGDGHGGSRWNTLEFKLYAVIFVLVVPAMVYWPMRLSSMNHPNYWFYAHRLSPGWLFGWQVDNSDAQYSSFRNGIPGLLALAASYLSMSFVHDRISPTPSTTRPLFTCILASLVLLILHGVSALKVLGILVANYRICVADKPATVQRAWPGLLIAGNMGVLFICERYGGLPLAGIHGSLGWLDEWSGLLPGWQHHFKITMLRIVSFGLDYHWRMYSPGVSDPPSDHRTRVSRSVPTDQYTLVNFIAYAIYPPLYIAGPIMTFNDFTWQASPPLSHAWLPRLRAIEADCKMRHPVSIPVREKISYGIRFVFCFLTMESVLHTMYVVAIKDAKAWEGDSPADLSMIGFWNLVVVWLKLLIPWRFFRFWALLDGMDAPENMIRCVANNYSTLGFWRSWHRSYNLWVVRYIYIPVGGGRNAALSTLLVFTFVALWHDLSFKLLAWGWLVSLFILPELLARKVLPYEKYGHEPWYRHVAAIGGVGNILLMMSANLVGFVLGIEGMKHLVVQLSTTVEGWVFTAFSCACLFVAVQVMFEYRAEEQRRGIDRRC